MTEEYWDQVMALNLKSAFLCVRAVWEEMAERKTGYIINVTSIAGSNGGGSGLGLFRCQRRTFDLHQESCQGACTARDPRERCRAGRDRHSLS